MTRAVVCVATTPHYQKGMDRLSKKIEYWHGGCYEFFKTLPRAWPTHEEKPYAFKAYALKEAEERADLLLWCDASILPCRDWTPLWERIERDGYWISRNGFSNSTWTADSAYLDLFKNEFGDGPVNIDQARTLNRTIEHVVATTFGLNVKHPKGKAFLDEYYRLASQTKAFCGPWRNTAWKDPQTGMVSHPVGPTCGACGPSDVRGHRHDQTAASVIAWRLGMELTSPPEIFAYSKRRPDGTLHLSDQDERTILLADGSFHDGVVHA